MQNAAADTDVLIVGAGPVGLFLANECARRGLRYRIKGTTHFPTDKPMPVALIKKLVKERVEQRKGRKRR
jgi:thioredoxin reductase